MFSLKLKLWGYLAENNKLHILFKKVTHILVYWQVQIIVAVTSVLCISYVLEHKE